MWDTCLFFCRNLDQNTPKNAYFGEKSCKIAAASGLCPRTPVGLRRLGLCPRPPHQSSYIVNSSLCICPQKAQILSESTIRPYFLVIIDGVHPGFQRRKNYAAFCIPQISEILTISFNFSFWLAPPLVPHFPPDMLLSR